MTMTTLDQINRAERILMDRLDAMVAHSHYASQRLLGRIARTRRSAWRLRQRTRDGNYEGGGVCTKVLKKKEW